MKGSLKHLEPDSVTFDKIHVGQSTFLNGLAADVHSWFRLTPSFGPELVDLMLQECCYKEGNLVIDPFSGASTTLIQCKLRGISSFGIEINPLLHFVGTVCLNWDLEPRVLKRHLAKIVQKYETLSRKYHKTDLEDSDLQIPSIHNVFRWWRKDVLKDLLILKKAIKEIKKPEVRDFFRLALAGVLVPDLTNVTLGRLQLHFIDRSKDQINVVSTFLQHADHMISNLRKVKAETKPNKHITRLIHGDSTEAQTYKTKDSVDIVITSPPYPNRYSYVWNTRPHLFFLDFFDSAKQSSALDLKTIGGTWGTATSSLMKSEIHPAYEFLEEIVFPHVLEIRETDLLMSNYLMKYFNLLSKQLVTMQPKLSKNAKLAYVVGNVNLKGVYVPTDELLAKVFKALGCRSSKVRRFRRRNSGKDLFETIVYGFF